MGLTDDILQGWVLNNIKKFDRNLVGDPKNGTRRISGQLFSPPDTVMASSTTSSSATELPSVHPDLEVPLNLYSVQAFEFIGFTKKASEKHLKRWTSEDELSFQEVLEAHIEYFCHDITEDPRTTMQELGISEARQERIMDPHFNDVRNTATLHYWILELVLENLRTLEKLITMSVTVPQTSHAGGIDDELTALTLQLEELGVYSEAKKGKHPIDQPPDIEVAYSRFQIELQAYEDFLADQKLAQSIGAAVHSDSVVIEDLTSQDVQAREDRRFALELSSNDPEIEAPPLSVHDHLQGEVHDWMSAVSGNIAAASVVEFSDDETEAGPAMSYVERQADTIKKLSTEFNCCTCYDRFPRASMVTAKCGDRYCVDCMKGLFMRSTKDESLYPPRCCKQKIPLDLIARHMEPNELATFELAIVEYATQKKTYCSNHDCATFIVPDSIEPDTNRAMCPKCGAETCAICNNEFHAGSACPDDPLLRQTRELAREMGWQTCNACYREVDLRIGCNHIT
ncbi:hypothetical protein AG0111_0g7281 [Alternaria gaisen]|uniref:Uncharacterized protein n=1 Tax=Alternaria gaisen TaxID=167740 RepID=A0ACB6FHP7_9PLEO|nr:hypothetical protein AG0111_0g7281 [Alternaria gaisen]